MGRDNFGGSAKNNTGTKDHELENECYQTKIHLVNAPQRTSKHEGGEKEEWDYFPRQNSSKRLKITLTNTCKTAPPTAHVTIEISAQEPCAVESCPCAQWMRVLDILYRDGRSDSGGDGGDSGGTLTVWATTAGSTTVGTDFAPRWGTHRCSLNSLNSIPLHQTVCRWTIEQSSIFFREY